MRWMFLLSTFLLFQATQPQQPQSSQQTASIEGVVVRFGTTDGVARARVTLSGSGTPQAVTADTEGKFTFKDLSAGTYRLNVTRDGFVPAEHGQRGPNSQGVPIVVNAQQQVRDIRISMTESGTIAGRVRNRYGEPAVNATVQALRYTYQEGKRSLTAVQSARTNDLGEFRLFWLTPGQYVVSAQPMDTVGPGGGETLFLTSGVGARASAPPLGTGGITRIVVGGPGGAMPPPSGGRGGRVDVEPTEVSIPVYFPNTTDATRASAVDLRPGATFGGVDLTVVEARAVRIRGQVFAGGQPARGANVAIFARGGAFGGFSIRSANVGDTGTFEFRGFAPGVYEVVATLNGQQSAFFMEGTALGTAAGGPVAMTMMPAGGPRMGARRTIDVGSSDVEGVVLSMDAGATIVGRITVEGRALTANDPALANVRVQLQSDPNVPPLLIPAVAVSADGTFSIAGVTPGDYRLVVLGLQRNTYVRSARFGGADMLNGGLRIEGDPRGAIEIALGTTPATLDVAVLDDRRLPVSGVTVALVPAAAQQKRFDIYRTAASDASGRVRLEGVVPGDYQVFAWEEVEANAWTDPDFIRNFENRGAPVRLDAGGAMSVEARVIPYKTN